MLIAIAAVTALVILFPSSSAKYIGKKDFTVTVRSQSEPRNYDIDMEQTFVVPVSGYYFIEVWGGSDGEGTYNEVFTDGIGGISQKIQGHYYLEAGTVLYIYVGSSGESTYVFGNIDIWAFGQDGEVIITFFGS